MGMQPGEEVNWRTVPGASVLFKAFLLEMKQRPLHRWPESMRTCMVALSVEYRNILQVFARILLGRVIARQLRPTLPAIKLLSTCFDSIGDDGTLPKQFSVPLLVKQLELMVDSDHFKVVACALLFLYSHIDRLPEPARLDALRPREADFPLPDDGADALAARVPAPAAPRVRAQLARLDDALGDAAYAFPALAF